MGLVLGTLCMLLTFCFETKKKSLSKQYKRCLTDELVADRVICRVEPVDSPDDSWVFSDASHATRRMRNASFPDLN